MPSVNWEELRDQILNMLKTESIGYIQNHMEDVQVLGEETVKAILSQGIIDSIPIPVLPEGASQDDIETVEKILTRRDQIAQLISKASLENAQRVEKLKVDATAIGIKIGGYIVQLGLGILVTL